MTTGDSTQLSPPALPNQNTGNTPGDLYTLAPLREHGADALATHDTPPIAKVKVLGVETVQENARHNVLIHKADDIFQTTAAVQHLNPIPATGTIAAATFDFEIHDVPAPVIADVRLPHTVKLSNPDVFAIIADWLQKHFSAAKLAAIILVIVSVLLAPLADDTDDPIHLADDPDPDHQTHFAT